MSTAKLLFFGLVSAGSAAALVAGPSQAAPRTAAPAPRLVSVSAPLYAHPGKVLAGNCFQCHGTNGKRGAFDSLAGESASEIYSEMKEMQTSTEAEEAIMGVHARGYSDAQIRLIADFFARVR